MMTSVTEEDDTPDLTTPTEASVQNGPDEESAAFQRSQSERKSRAPPPCIPKRSPSTKLTLGGANAPGPFSQTLEGSDEDQERVQLDETQDLSDSSTTDPPASGVDTSSQSVFDIIRRFSKDKGKGPDQTDEEPAHAGPPPPKQMEKALPPVKQLAKEFANGAIISGETNNSAVPEISRTPPDQNLHVGSPLAARRAASMRVTSGQNYETTTAPQIATRVLPAPPGSPQLGRMQQPQAVTTTSTASFGFPSSSHVAPPPGTIPIAVPQVPSVGAARGSKGKQHMETRAPTASKLPPPMEPVHPCYRDTGGKPGSAPHQPPPPIVPTVPRRGPQSPYHTPGPQPGMPDGSQSPNCNRGAPHPGAVTYFSPPLPPPPTSQHQQQYEYYQSYQYPHQSTPQQGLYQHSQHHPQYQDYPQQAYYPPPPPPLQPHFSPAPPQNFAHNRLHQQQVPPPPPPPIPPPVLPGKHKHKSKNKHSKTEPIFPHPIAKESQGGDIQAALIAQLKGGIKLRRSSDVNIRDDSTVQTQLGSSPPLPPPPPPPGLNSQQSYESDQRAQFPGYTGGCEQFTGGSQLEQSWELQSVFKKERGSNRMPEANGTIVDGIDVRDVPGYQPVPDNCPEWKKHLVERKNKEAIDAYKKQKEEEDEERRKWENVPQWKRHLLEKKDVKKKEDTLPTDEEQRRRDMEDQKLASMPEWKRNLMLKKMTEPDN